MTLPHIPILRRGVAYESLDKIELADVAGGEPIASVSHANAGLIQRDLRRVNRDAFRNITVEHLLEISAEAGRLFMEGTLPIGEQQQSPSDYIQSLSATSGLPHSLVRRNMAKIHQVFAQMGTILRGLTRGMDPSIIDRGYGEQSCVPVSYYATADSLAVVLPSNSPGVNSLWMPAVALKVPVILKPGREEPWTPFRIIQAFVAAGCPAEAFSFYPTDHEGSAAVLAGSNRAFVFGDVSTVERYAGNPGVQVHGPGWSKVLIGEDLIDRWEEFIPLIAASISDNGGRSCVNASAVIVPRHGDRIADRLARELSRITPRKRTDPEAVLAGFANPRMAESIDAAIEQDLDAPGAREVTSAYRDGPRRVLLEGSTYLQPTVVRCDSFAHPLANREFLFPYASVVEMAPEQMAAKIGPSLVVSAISNDDRFLNSLIASPHIDRLNIGPLPTTLVQWDQPHEGNLFEFLYKRRAIQRRAFQA